MYDDLMTESKISRDCFHMGVGQRGHNEMARMAFVQGTLFTRNFFVYPLGAGTV
jgi:hypothetical protein